MDCSTPGFAVLHHLWEFAQDHLHWVGDAIQPSRPLLPPSSPALNLSQYQGLFQWVGPCITWPKYLSFIFRPSPSPSTEYSELISFRIDWFDLLAVQGTLKHLLQNHNSKASVLWCSAFFMVQFSHCTWDHLHWDQKNQKFTTNSRIFSPRCLNWWICLLLALSIQCSLNNYSSLNYLFNYSEHTTAPFISIWDYKDDNKPSWKMAFKILAP